MVASSEEIAPPDITKEEREEDADMIGAGVLVEEVGNPLNRAVQLMEEKLENSQPLDDRTLEGQEDGAFPVTSTDSEDGEVEERQRLLSTGDDIVGDALEVAGVAEECKNKGTRQKVMRQEENKEKEAYDCQWRRMPHDSASSASGDGDWYFNRQRGWFWWSNDDKGYGCRRKNSMIKRLSDGFGKIWRTKRFNFIEEIMAKA
eukprot:GEMP01035909.1.p1 GENE.GEMP01035909.1~~GEMP01035909.1.p1  ORF type:complete len:203 (+),score=49.23 GEMP01035909.1:1058-1666(+)